MDKRTIRTTRKLQKALIELLMQKPINHISVCQLCQTAEVNRSTFYVYYKGIDELMEEIEQDAMECIEEIVQDNPGGVEQLRHLMRFISENQKLYRVVLQYSVNALANFSHIMQTRFHHKRNLSGAQRDMPETPYLYELLYTGTLGVIQKWLENDCREKPEMIADMVWRTVLFCENQKNFGNPLQF